MALLVVTTSQFGFNGDPSSIRLALKGIGPPKSLQHVMRATVLAVAVVGQDALATTVRALRRASNSVLSEALQLLGVPGIANYLTDWG